MIRRLLLCLFLVLFAHLPAQAAEPKVSVLAPWT